MWGLQTVATFHRYSRTHRVGLQGLVLTYRVYPNLKSVQFRKAKEFMRVKFPVLQKYVKNLRFISHFHFHFHSHSHSHFPFRHRPFLVRRSPPPVILLSHVEPLSVPIRRCPPPFASARFPTVSDCFRPRHSLPTAFVCSRLFPSAVIRFRLPPTASVCCHSPSFAVARLRLSPAAPDCLCPPSSRPFVSVRFCLLPSAYLSRCAPTSFASSASRFNSSLPISRLCDNLMFDTASCNATIAR